MGLKITPPTAATKAAIKRKSAYNLPNRPSERGMKPEDIKAALAGPIVDPDASLMSELERVVNEANRCFESLGTSELPEITDEDNGKILCVVDGSWGAVDIPLAEEESY